MFSAACTSALSPRPTDAVRRRVAHRTEPFLALFMVTNTDPAGMLSSAAIFRPGNPVRLSFATKLRNRSSRVPERVQDELLMNSIKAAFVWGDAGIAQLVRAADL
jgi:hypothetical protein